MAAKLQQTTDQWAALALVEDAQSLSSQWRVHFHVPVYLAEFGLLRTSRDDILELLTEVRQDESLTHLEVETYTWNVLPERYRKVDVSVNIARELSWVIDELKP